MARYTTTHGDKCSDHGMNVYMQANGVLRGAIHISTTTMIKTSKCSVGLRIGEVRVDRQGAGAPSLPGFLDPGLHVCAQLRCAVLYVFFGHDKACIMY